MIVISKTSMYGTEKTDNPVYDTIYSKDNGLGTDDQQEENPSYGEKYIVYVSRLKQIY